jgi:SPP1 family predicted phage head-tail adaptor
MPQYEPEVGDLRQRVTYQIPSKTLDAFNQPLATWTSLGTFWAKVEPLAGMELMNARQLKGTTSHKVILRNVNSALAPNAITPSGRFLFEATGRALGVDAVYRINEQNAWLAIHCTELISPQ